MGTVLNRILIDFIRHMWLYRVMICFVNELGLGWMFYISMNESALELVIQRRTGKNPFDS